MEKYKVIIDADFEELVPNFLKNRKLDVVKLKELIIEENYAMIGNLGHSLSGVGYNYGFNFIGNIGEELQMNVDTKDIKAIKDLIVDLENYIDNLVINYEKI